MLGAGEDQVGRFCRPSLGNVMSLNIAKPLATLSQSARDQKLLARGRLVSPDQLHGLPFTSEVMPPDAWLLIGELHPRLFQLLKSGGQPSIDVTLLQANIGIFYLVVRYLIGDWEHRFVLPMAGASARAYVKSMEQYGVHTALTSTGSAKAFFNYLQRSPSDEVVKKLLSTDIPDFVGDGAALAVESIASALQLLDLFEVHRWMPPIESLSSDHLFHRIPVQCGTVGSAGFSLNQLAL